MMARGHGGGNGEGGDGAGRDDGGGGATDEAIDTALAEVPDEVGRE